MNIVKYIYVYIYFNFVVVCEEKKRWEGEYFLLFY